MENKLIHRLILKFFENDVPKETQRKFHQWFVSEDSFDEKRKAMSDIWENHTAEEDDQSQADLSRLYRRIDRYEKKRFVLTYRWAIRVAACLLLPLLGGLFTYYLKQDKAVIKEPELIECFVPYGERRHIFLSDGSEVWVNAGSLLVYSKEFEGNTRTLFLNGEAYFNVAKDPEKPFIVKTETMDVEAVGTSFNVQSYPEASNCVTTLETGKVRIYTKTDEPEPYILLPDEQLVYNRVAQRIIRRKVDANKNTNWKLGYLVFQNNTFDDIMRAVERNYGVTVNYNSDKFHGRAFTIRFTPEEGLEQVFEVIKNIAGIKYTIEGKTINITN